MLRIDSEGTGNGQQGTLRQAQCIAGKTHVFKHEIEIMTLFFFGLRILQQIVIKPGTRTPPPTPSPQAMRGLRCTLYD